MNHQLWVLILFSAISWAGTPRLFEDPQKAPLALEKWQIPKRVSHADWIRFLGKKAGQSYLVKSGDTLSKICEKELGSPDYWPKLWEVNKEQVANPHIIEPGIVLSYSEKKLSTPERSLSSSQSSTKNKKELPEELPDRLIRKDLVNKIHHRLFILNKQPFAGVVTGSYSDKSNLDLNSIVYIGIADPSQILPDKVFSVVREVESPLALDKSSHLQGKQMVQLVGEVQIEKVGSGNFATAQITRLSEIFHRGDRLIALPPLEMKSEDIQTPINLTSKIILGEEVGKKNIIPGEVFLVDKGTKQGMNVGFVFGVFEDTDPVLKKRDLIEPRSKGEVQIVFAGDSWSTGYLRKSEGVIELGDILISKAAFSGKNDSTNQLIKRQTTALD